MSEERAPGVFVEELLSKLGGRGVPALTWALALTLVAFALVRLRRRRGRLRLS